MAYIGKTPIVGNFQKCDAITTSATDTFNLLVGGVAVSPESSFSVICSLNGVIQEAGASGGFTISGSTIVFNSALTTSDTIDFILLLGSTLDIGIVSDGTITAAKLDDTCISGKTALASEPDDTDEFLVSDAGTLKRIDYSLIKGRITEVDNWRLSASFSGSSGAINSGWERVDTYGFNNLGTGISESSGTFSFPSTGLYLISVNTYIDVASALLYAGYQLRVSTDGINYNTAMASYGNVPTTNYHIGVNSNYLFNVTNTSNDKVQLHIHAGGTVQYAGNTSANFSAITFMRLGDST